MLIFVDFETKSLNGMITEACAIDAELNIIYSLNFHENINKLNKKEKKIKFEEFIQQVVNYNNEENIIVFWHHFMPVWLFKFQKNAYEILEGKFLIFTDIYSFYDEIKKSRYSIQSITKDLLDRDHQGNAVNDSIDLAECFLKIR